jgi:hypothetical protein
MSLKDLNEVLSEAVLDRLYRDQAAFRQYTLAGVKDHGLAFLLMEHGLPEAAVRKVAEFHIQPAEVSMTVITCAHRVIALTQKLFMA